MIPHASHQKLAPLRIHHSSIVTSFPKCEHVCNQIQFARDKSYKSIVTGEINL